MKNRVNEIRIRQELSVSHIMVQGFMKNLIFNRVTLVAHCPFPVLNMNKSVLSLSDLPSAARAEPQLASLKSPCTVTGSQVSLESKFK